MKIDLIRDTFTEQTSIGKLYINDEYFCETLEDKDRNLNSDMTLEEIAKIKVYGKTAIPYGRYDIALTFSNKFGKYLPLVVNVPGYAGIRMHSGVNALDTLGCILIGYKRGVDSISDSRTAIAALLKIIAAAIKKEKIMLTITKLIT